MWLQKNETKEQHWYSVIIVKRTNVIYLKSAIFEANVPSLIIYAIYFSYIMFKIFPLGETTY